jgi:hypothetical protein
MHALDGKTPYKMVHGLKPDLANLPEWGMKLFVLKQDRAKLEPKPDEGRWVGYSDESKGHRIYWPGKHLLRPRSTTSEQGWARSEG